MIYIRQINIDCDALREAGSYVAGLPFLRNWEPLTLDAPVTFFVGENGSGKSTLIEGIAVVAGFNPEGGSKNFNFSTRASHSDLCDHLRLTRGLDGKWRDGYFLRAESFYNVA
ncbi:MAG: AAA family ATPase, partial [Clostridia bacterium]|nr:AAA family ATPase [Clostridia bacterium]